MENGRARLRQKKKILAPGEREELMDIGATWRLLFFLLRGGMSYLAALPKRDQATAAFSCLTNESRVHIINVGVKYS